MLEIQPVCHAENLIYNPVCNNNNNNNDVIDAKELIYNVRLPQIYCCLGVTIIAIVVIILCIILI